MPFIFVGFDITTDAGYEEFIVKFDQVVGLQYLKAMHINDSKGWFVL